MLHLLSAIKRLIKVDGTAIELDELESDNFSDAKTYTTDGNGEITITGMKPGVYKIEETTPPRGYEKTSDVRYVVITGGLSIGTVTVDGTQLHNMKSGRIIKPLPIKSWFH